MLAQFSTNLFNAYVLDTSLAEHLLCGLGASHSDRYLRRTCKGRFHAHLCPKGEQQSWRNPNQIIKISMKHQMQFDPAKGEFEQFNSQGTSME